MFFPMPARIITTKAVDILKRHAIRCTLTEIPEADFMGAGTAALQKFQTAHLYSALKIRVRLITCMIADLWTSITSGSEKTPPSKRDTGGAESAADKIKI